jgi:glutathione S-transferase
MSLTLHFHPLSSFCQKVLVALYENGTPFRPYLVDLSDEASGTAFRTLWPIGKFPVLVDDARDQTIPESTIIIEYLAQHYPGGTPLVPADADRAREARLLDRFFDLYVDMPMQAIVGDRRRPPGAKDPFGVDEARQRLRTAYRMIEKDMATKTWATGEAFSMADCAAAPALYYANLVEPFGGGHANVAGYFERLMARPSFARAVKEADPYRYLFPKET